MATKKSEGLVLKYKTPFPAVQPVVLNIEEMKVAATAFSAKYKGQVVTRETFAEGKQSAMEQKKVIDALKAAKTELRRRAGEIVASAIAGIDEVLAIVEPTYKELHDGLVSVKSAFDKEKLDSLYAAADKLAATSFPELTAARDHLRHFVDAKCAEKKGGWLTKAWTVDAAHAVLAEECQRMGRAMGFINAHLKGKPVDVVRVAKTALVNNAFNEVVALEAMDKYEKTLEDQRRMAAVRAGRDPDQKPAPKPVPASDPVTPNSRMMTATVKFTASVEEMRKLVMIIKNCGIPYEVLEQKYVNTENKE